MQNKSPESCFNSSIHTVSREIGVFSQGPLRPQSSTRAVYRGKLEVLELGGEWQEGHKGEQGGEDEAQLPA
jgi:hypothetical protein